MQSGHRIGLLLHSVVGIDAVLLQTESALGLSDKACSITSFLEVVSIMEIATFMETVVHVPLTRHQVRVSFSPCTVCRN